MEGVNSNLVIIDIITKNEPIRIINIYRSFSPQDNVSARVKFNYQMELAKEALNTKSILLGDFNLDYNKCNDDNYVPRNLFSDFEEKFEMINVIQMIDFVTWSRIVGNVLKESTLDHIYTKSPTSISNLYSIMPLFGDHRVIT